MTTKAQSVAEEVEAIRESLALIGPEAKYVALEDCLWQLKRLDIDHLESIELWARLAADTAGSLRGSK